MGDAATGWKDPVSVRFARRIVSIPLYLVVCFGFLAILPAVLALAIGLDLIRRKRFVATRCALFFQWYLLCEVVGIAATFAILVATRDPDLEIPRFFRLQCGWLTAIFWGGARIFGFQVETEGDDVLSDGPLLVFMRHASTADIALPNVLISAKTGLVLRYVLKRELLWDPCLDLAGHRLVNAFIRRGSGNAEREIAAVRSLGVELGPMDGVLIYPEGTRFTAAKQARALERIRAGGNAERTRRAERLTRVLPPRLGGPVALLDEAPNADVLFVAHTGLDGARTMRDFLNGALVGARVRVAFWRVASGDVPRDAEGRERWLFDQWDRVDEWVGRNAAEAMA